MGGQELLLRKLPAIDRVLREKPLQQYVGQLPQELLTAAVAQVVEGLRREIREHTTPPSEQRLAIEQVAAAAAEICAGMLRSSLGKVLNATGTLLHTNLGRAPLAKQALAAINQIAGGYSNLELDLKTGQRGERFSHVEALLCQLTGAEAALVVNNNAGAVLLALTALGKGREAIVSRGELVEIGGAFRIPEVMEAGGVILREVGASNRTHLKDYQQAIGEQTALLLKVHTSNYRIVGFTQQIEARELAILAKEHGLVLLEDLGSGMLLDLSAYGLPQEPTVAETIAAGVDLVTFSGDKLLGGPQAGVVLGRRELVQKLRRHPLARALRIDKLTLAALEATLRLYLQPEIALQELPILQMFAIPAEELRLRCDSLAQRLARESLPIRVRLVEDQARVGGGAMPLVELPDWAVEIELCGGSLDRLMRRLRGFMPALIGRAQNDRLLINLRAIPVEEEALLVQILIAALQAED
ncbi:MAG TPA: L-seryl-tRNA(Sec) selenium transferase [Malonomonas sp.]